MIKKILVLSFLLIFSSIASEHPESGREELTQELRYFLPEMHPLKETLDTLFSSSSILEDSKAFESAGFITLYHQPSGMRVARHLLLPGYLVKVYLHSEQNQHTGLQWMIDRCQGADNIRQLIKVKNLKYFTVPDKWIYRLPDTTAALLVVTDMNLVNKKRSVRAWKTKITPQHLEELYCLLSHGFASCYLPYNIPYTKEGTFACVDTAYPYRKHSYRRIKFHLSEDMGAYWDLLEKTEEQP